MSTAPAATTNSTPFNSASLYIGDLAPDVTEALLFERFNHVGPVASVRVCRDAQSRRSLGYAYINFHRMEDAERALDSLNFSVIRNRPCRIMWSHRDPTLRKSGQGNIFIKNLSETIDNKSLYDTFSMFGNILSCKVAQNAEGKSMGYGFVHYDNHSNAKTAIERVHKKVIAGQVVTVEFFKPKMERFGETPLKFTNIFVKHIPDEWDESRFLEVFGQHGRILSGKLSVDDEGKSRGFGFVDYSDHKEAQQAIEKLNNSEQNGKTLYVGRAQKRREREEQLRQRYYQRRTQQQNKFQGGGNLYVKHLGDEMDETRLKATFEKYGQVASVRIVKDPASQKSRGFGFVCFKRPEDADRAMHELNNTFVDNKPLYVGLAQKSSDRKLELEQQFNARNKMAMGMAPPQPINFGGGVPQPVQMPIFPGYPTAAPYAYPPPGYGVVQPQPSYVSPYPPTVVRPYAPVQVAPMMRHAQATAQQQAYQQHMQPHPAMQMAAQVPRRIAARQPVFAQPTVMPIQQQQMLQRNKAMAQQQQLQQRQISTRQVNHVQQSYPVGGMVAQQQVGRPHQVAAQAAAPASDEAPPPTMQSLAGKAPDERKQLLGEALFKKIKPIDGEQAGKITGMLLEMEDSELLGLIHEPLHLKKKVQEAQAVLQEHVLSTGGVPAQPAQDGNQN